MCIFVILGSMIQRRGFLYEISPVGVPMPPGYLLGIELQNVTNRNRRIGVNNVSLIGGPVGPDPDATPKR